MSGPRRHRPTGLHLGRPASLVAALSRRRGRPEGVRVGDGTGPMRPLEASDPAAQRALEAGRTAVEAARDGQIG